MQPATKTDLDPCCSCKKTGCLKLYCHCFKEQSYCYACTEDTCRNQPSHIDRNLTFVVRNLMKKRPEQFVISDRTKLSPGAHYISLHDTEITIPTKNLRYMSCTCKVSKCSQFHCDCYKAGIPCGTKCICTGCHNKRPRKTFGPDDVVEWRHKQLDEINSNSNTEEKDLTPHSAETSCKRRLSDGIEEGCNGHTNKDIKNIDDSLELNKVEKSTITRPLLKKKKLFDNLIINNKDRMKEIEKESEKEEELQNSDNGDDEEIEDVALIMANLKGAT